MLKRVPLKSISQLLLAVLLILAVGGMHERAHARQTGASALHVCHEAQPPSHSPEAPASGSHDCDGCNVCVGCACLAPMPVPRFQLSYTPVILELDAVEPFQHLPEVYLSKFIPPQNRA